MLRFASIVAAMWLILACIALADDPPATQPQIAPASLKITGPFVHGNLAVYLIHGPDRNAGKVPLTLQEAMEKGIVQVKETGQVNNLTVENTSGDQEVYLQSGDIVKGGRQDRTIASDGIIPPKSGAMSIDVFCVESGRWHGRGEESASLFASSKDSISGANMKLSARNDQAPAAQQSVWAEAKTNQEKLTRNGFANASATSPSSFQLSMEAKDVTDAQAAYSKDLDPVIRGEGTDDVIGYAFAVNGKISSADVYNSHALFVKLWPKLLKSSIVEAMEELQKDKTFDAPKAESISATLAEAEKGNTTQRDVTPRVRMLTCESGKQILFQTVDPTAAPASPWLHRNYLANVEKPKARPEVLLPVPEPQQRQQNNPQPQQQAPANQPNQP